MLKQIFNKPHTKPITQFNPPPQHPISHQWKNTQIKHGITALQPQIDEFLDNATPTTQDTTNKKIDLKVNLPELQLVNWALASGIQKPKDIQIPELITTNKLLYFAMIVSIAKDHHRDKSKYLNSMIQQYHQCQQKSEISPQTLWQYADKTLQLGNKSVLESLSLVYENMDCQQMIITKSLQKDGQDQSITQKIYNESLNNKNQVESGSNFFSQKKVISSNMQFNQLKCGVYSFQVHGLRKGHQYVFDLVKLDYQKKHKIVYKSELITSLSDYISLSLPQDLIKSYDMNNFMIHIKFQGKMNTQDKIKLETSIVAFGNDLPCQKYNNILIEGFFKTISMLYSTDNILSDSRGYAVREETCERNFIKQLYADKFNKDGKRNSKYIDNCHSFFGEHLIRDILGKNAYKLHQQQKSIGGSDQIVTYDKDKLLVYIRNLAGLFSRFVKLANTKRVNEIAKRFRKVCLQRGWRVPECYKQGQCQMSVPVLKQKMMEIQSRIVLAKKQCGIV